MKAGIVLLSIVTMAATAWWLFRNNRKSRLSFREKLHIVGQSLVTGVAVYFALLLLAVIYLSVTG
jgi:cbb3-type cytochrome oxidase subunit 3